MPEKGWEDLPENDGDASNRFDVDGFRARLFGGPAATLYGDQDIPAQSAWDSKEIPRLGPETSGVAPFSDGGSWGSSVDMFSDHTGSHQTGSHHTGSFHTGSFHTGSFHTGSFHTGSFQTGSFQTGSHSRVSQPASQDSSLVRPYFKTGGRTRPDYDLAIEALVSTSERGKDPEAAVRQEHRSICDLCLDTRSVAEVAVHLKLPLGAARVLIGDMAGMGLVLIHQSGMVAGDRPSIEFMERVLSGLRRL